MGNQANLQRRKAVKHTFSLYMYFQSDCTFGGETHTVDGETPFLGLPVFDSADQVIVVGEGIFLRLKPKN